MTTKNQTIKEYVRQRDGGFCQRCRRSSWSSGHIAHRIAETKTNISIYGRKIIDHPYNKVWVCSLECNDSFNIGYKPEQSRKLAELINKKGNKKITMIKINEILNKKTC
jgi:hypothetical protein